MGKTKQSVIKVLETQIIKLQKKLDSINNEMINLGYGTGKITIELCNNQEYLSKSIKDIKEAINHLNFLK